MSKRKVTQAEVDRIVTEQAAEESAWERPVVVSRPIRAAKKAVAS